MAQAADSLSAEHQSPWPEPEVLLNHPDQLLQARCQVLASGAHLHGPDVAERLRVPEAAIMAARIGVDARRLKTDLAGLLAPLPNWSKCLLAIRNRLGVALALGRFQAPEVRNHTLRLRSEEHEAKIELDFAHESFWLEETDAMHGHSFSLNVFDAEGHALLRVYLLSKEGREQALAHLLGMLAPDQQRSWRASRAPNPVPRNPSETAALSDPPDFAREQARAALRASLLALPQMSEASIHMQSRSSFLRSCTQLRQANETGSMSHATGPALKLHLRPDAAALMRRERGAEGEALLWQTDEGDELSLAPGRAVAAAQAQAWLEAGLAPQAG